MAKKSTRKPGRPKGTTASKTRKEFVQFKAFADEKRNYESTARKAGLSLSAWIRFTLNREVNQ